MSRTRRPFTEAVKGGMSGKPDAPDKRNTLRFHSHLIIHSGMQTEVHELKSLDDLHKHSEALKRPTTKAELHVGIGTPKTVEQARQQSDSFSGPNPSNFHTHVALRKKTGSTTFIPSYMYTASEHQRKGWGTTLWDHLHRKLTKAGLGLDHDWQGQTADGYAWSRKSSGKEAEPLMHSRYDLERRLDDRNEWHKLTHEQKSGFLTTAHHLIGRGKGEFNDPKARHSKGLVGDTEVHHLRNYMKKTHGVNMHPFSVADTLHHMTGREGPYSYQSGYHGASLPRLSTRFDLAQSKRANAGKGEPNELVRTPLKGDKKPGIAARRRAKAAMNAAPKEPLKHATYYF